MATELEGNVKLQRFIQLLADLNHETVAMIKTGDMKLLYKMNLSKDKSNIRKLPLKISNRNRN